MLEVVMIFDHEFQQNFKNIIFHLVLQKFHDDIHKYIIIINKAYFMLEEEPKFDKPEPLHLCIFYDKVDYSLTELYNLLIHEKLRLNEDCLVKMGVQLI